MSEFARLVDIREADGKRLSLSANEQERSALAQRFGIVRIDRLEADVSLQRDGDAVIAAGILSADLVQSCAVSAEDLPVAISEPLSFRFVPEAGDPRPDEEIELEAGELDEIEYAGSSFDLGEAVAQSLGLAIDPFAIGPEAERVRQEAGLLREGETRPFAALKGLLKE